MTDQNAPAGWYPDANGGNRWWDGTQWTEHVQAPEALVPAPAAPAAAPAPSYAPSATSSTAQSTGLATAAPSTPTLVSDHVSLTILGVAVSVLVLIGSVGPWATVGEQSVNGTADGADGILTLIGAILAAGTFVATTYLPAGVPRIIAQWATVVIGLAITIIGIIDLQDVNSSGFVSAGWGLWLVVLAGVAVTVVGVLLALLRGHKR